MRLRIQFDAELFAARPAAAVVMIEAAAPTSSTVTFGPEIPSEVIHDFYGNTCRRLHLPGGLIRVEYDASVDYAPAPVDGIDDVDADLMTIPAEDLIYTLPSRYCPSDEFARLAEDTFGKARAGLTRVQDIATWVNTHLEYAYGTSDVNTSARDTIVHCAGVCRDFAHLGITFCRALNIPSRYVSAYCLDLKPQDLHAYFEAYVGGQWVPFDATTPATRPALVPIAVGRDAADCAWWTSYGPCVTNRMAVKVEEIDES